MTNISKRQLNPKHLDSLFTQLNTTLGRLDKKAAGSFMEDLLGAEERIMLSKRFAIIVMLMEENSTYRIAQVLKVSTSTVTSLHIQYDNGRFDRIVNMLRRNSTDYEKLWTLFEKVLRAGLPPQGKGRWRSVFKA